jgi:hypothetical protein
MQNRTRKLPLPSGASASTWGRPRKVRLILQTNPDWTDLYDRLPWFVDGRGKPGHDDGRDPAQTGRYQVGQFPFASRKGVPASASRRSKGEGAQRSP